MFILLILIVFLLSLFTSTEKFLVYAYPLYMTIKVILILVSFHIWLVNQIDPLLVVEAVIINITSG